MRKDVKPACSRKPVFWFVRCALMAAPLVLAAFHAQPANAEISEEMAGVSAAVTGDVTMARTTGEVGVLVESGMPVYLGDRITTSGNSGMQILLLDETVFTIGPNSDIAIDEFVYDPASGDGRIVADMARGVMRFVTGKIPLNNPSSMDINLPVGSIGIRGTIGLIRSVSAEQANEVVPGSFDTSTPEAANQQVFMAVNQGPGLQRNDTTSRPGAFAVNDQNGNSENVTGENFGVFVSNGAVTTPTRFPENIATFDFSTNLVRTASRSNDPAGSNGGSSGSTSDTNSSLTPSQSQQADTQTGATMAGSIEVAMAQVGATQATSSQGEITEILGNVDSSNSNSSDNDPFSYDGLRQITTGSVTTGTINIDGANVDYSFASTVDFANRTIAIEFSNVTQTGSGLTGKAGILDGGFNPTTFDYTNTNGNVAFESGDFTYDPNCTTLGCSATATFQDAYNVDFNLSTTTYSSGTDGSATLN
ncbi:FecR family protein [Thalassospira australica]|uniref:FecR family protein n=1 Tax=Thalassospira australica TaxID=1528106 RepID=UPI0009DF724F|nr:FecR domain-containing protein [Thalassospira australica]